MSTALQQHIEKQNAETEAQNAEIVELRSQVRRGAKITQKLLDQLLALGVTTDTIESDRSYGKKFSSRVAIVAGRDRILDQMREVASDEAEVLRQQEEADRTFREQRQAIATRRQFSQRELKDIDAAIGQLWDACPIEIKQTRSRLKQQAVASRRTAQDLKEANDRERIEINRLEKHREEHADEIEMRKRRIAANEAKILEVEQQAADLAEQSDSLSRTWFLEQ
jgi:hypothetical protein